MLRSSDIGDGALAPLPTLLMNHRMTELGLDRLSFHHTSIDTTVVAKETDKGSGLVALRDWVLGPQAETVAAGDQEPDLHAFRVATRSFAPANVGCARAARLLGCRIVRRANQPGLLEIARMLVSLYRPGAGAEDGATAPAAHDDAFMDALRAADRGLIANLARSVFGRRGAALSRFIQSNRSCLRSSRIHVAAVQGKAWMAGTSPAMTDPAAQAAAAAVVLTAPSSTAISA